MPDDEILMPRTVECNISLKCRFQMKKYSNIINDSPTYDDYKGRITAIRDFKDMLI